MRKSRQETAETHERIVSVAIREFNEHGIEGIGLADIMAAAGLTHGGFYKHFESKDNLVGEAVSKALERSAIAMGSAKASKSLEGAVSEYLSRKHRDDAAESCPLTTLGCELRHADAQTKQIASSGLDQFVATIASHLSDLPKKQANAKARAIVSALVGSMMLSRIATDPKVSDNFLRDTRNFLLQQ